MEIKLFRQLSRGKFNDYVENIIKCYFIKHCITLRATLPDFDHTHNFWYYLYFSIKEGQTNGIYFAPANENKFNEYSK